MMRLIQSASELLLPPATGEGWDGGDADLIYIASNAHNPPSLPSPISMGEGDIAMCSRISIEMSFKQNEALY
jgi:hypothetical protein